MEWRCGGAEEREGDTRERRRRERREQTGVCSYCFGAFFHFQAKQILQATIQLENQAEKLLTSATVSRDRPEDKVAREQYSQVFRSVKEGVENVTRVTTTGEGECV